MCACSYAHDNACTGCAMCAALVPHGCRCRSASPRQAVWHLNPPPLSSNVQVRVAKNTILRRAIEGDAKWSVVGPQLESSNMWFFIGSDLKVRCVTLRRCAVWMCA